MVAAGIWYETSPTKYDFGNGAQIVVPWGAVSADRRDAGYGVVVQSGINVMVQNNSDQWRTLTMSYRRPDCSILDTHAFEDLAPKSTKTFGADSDKYEGMHISVSDYAQKERDKANP